MGYRHLRVVRGFRTGGGQGHRDQVRGQADQVDREGVRRVLHTEPCHILSCSEHF